MDQYYQYVEAEDELRQQEERDMEHALQLSLQQSTAQRAGSSSKSRSSNGSIPQDKDLGSLDEEIEEVQAQIKTLQTLLDTLSVQREDKLREIRSAQTEPGWTDKGKAKVGGINYNSEFEWSGALSAKLKAVFGFDSFRTCQEGICNANIDARDIVAIMPTGGGKSLGYQLPALMTPGCTLVISPLLALISDQIMHLHEAGVDAVMLTGSMSREESENIFKRLQAMASGASNVPDIKLCYVTPEKIANSKKFKAALDKLYRVNKLARFVIDEAHCVSSQGHDFRPDYQKLGALRQMYPKVPILALSATCPAMVLLDLLKTLRMRAVTMASAAAHEGTVLFTTSLYRKNLHYSVLSKPSGANESIAVMRDYILTHHKNDTGIVYCLSKKDAESVAEALDESSKGAIKTGVYHADIQDRRKEVLHKEWREGRVKVVCATIAFGLGIDKGDVRFVLHHSMSKSLDGFYQESGRAGRDGKDAHCVLFYRPQDAFRIASLACGEQGGPEKVISMTAFASELEECRKIAFANYFNESSKLSLSSWATEQEDARTRCGHCDNCIRPPDALERLGTRTRVVAWQILRVLQAAGRDVTMAQLCDLARGVGGSKESTFTGGKGKGRAKEKVTVDVNKVAGGKVELSKEQTETICVRLLVDRYLTIGFQQTAYTVNVYLRPSKMTGRFTRFSREDIEQGKGPAFDCVFLAKVPTKRKNAASTQAQLYNGKRKRQPSASPISEEDVNANSFEGDESNSSSDDEWHTGLRSGTSRRAPQASPQPKRQRNSAAYRASATRTRTSDEVIVIDSD